MWKNLQLSHLPSPSPTLYRCLTTVAGKLSPPLYSHHVKINFSAFWVGCWEPEETIPAHCNCNLCYFYSTGWFNNASCTENPDIDLSKLRPECDFKVVMFVLVAGLLFHCRKSGNCHLPDLLRDQLCTLVGQGKCEICSIYKLFLVLISEVCPAGWGKKNRWSFFSF